MKCDLHVHSHHSGMCTVPFLKNYCRESYSPPEQVYTALKRKGMDLVTLTDHDSIEGAEALRRHPDFFVSEEVTCQMPSGNFAHIGVYDLTERQHVEIQRRRHDLPSLLAFLSEKRLFFAVNHVLSSLTGRRAAEDFYWFEEYLPAFEVLNGHMLPFHNNRTKQSAHKLGKAGVAGSDAHVVASAGSAYTEVPNVHDKSEFLREVRAGNGIAAGGTGNYLKLTRDVLLIGAGMVREKPTTALFASLAPVVPFVTLAILVHEMAFARRWSRRLGSAGSQDGWNGRSRSADLVESFAWP